MLLTAEQHRFLANDLLLEPGMMCFAQEKIYLLEQDDPDPYVIASLILFEYLPLKKRLPRNYEKQLHKASKEDVDNWLVATWHWVQANKAEISEYQRERRWHANRRCPDLNPRWKQFKELATEMTKEWKTCMCCGAGGNVHIDHVQPERLGGSFYNLKNIQVLCHVCNIKKSSTEKDHRNDTFKKHVAEFCDQNTRAYQMMLCTPEPSKAWLSSQPIKMRRVMHKSVA